jgi:4-hydroxy-tetrahydrodipicolinate synthase
VQQNDLARARALNDRIFPIAHAFYADPFVDMHNRMKEALVILGRIPCAAVRPPLVKLKEAEIRRIERALEQAGVRGHGAMERAA